VLLVGRDADARVGHGERAAQAGTGDVSGHGDQDLPGRSELDGVAHQVDDDLAQAGPVAQDLPAAVGGDVDEQVQPLAGRLRRKQLRDVVDEVREVERGPLEVELARLDLGEVQDVVDQRQQAVAAARDRVQVAALLLGQLRGEQQVGQPEDGVERGADLVAHGRKERRLGVPGALGVVAGGHQLALPGVDQRVAVLQGLAQFVHVVGDGPQLEGPGRRHAGLHPTGGELRESLADLLGGRDDLRRQPPVGPSHGDGDHKRHDDAHEGASQHDVVPLGAGVLATLLQGCAHLGLHGPVPVEEGLVPGDQVAQAGRVADGRL
jgi:hypothetical protein